VSEHKNIYAALAAAQGEFGKVVKDATNPHFRSGYATLAAVLEAALPVLSKHGLCLMQRHVNMSDGKMAVETILGHASGDTMEAITPMILGKFDMQQLGSATTYARRYAAMAMLGLSASDDDDDGNAATKAAPTKTEGNKAIPTVKEPSLAHMKRELDNLDHDLADTFTLSALQNLWAAWREKMNTEGWPPARSPDDEGSYRNQAKWKVEARKAEIEAKMAVADEPAEPPLRNPLMAGE
jgi:hypothetical protein